MNEEATAGDLASSGSAEVMCRIGKAVTWGRITSNTTVQCVTSAHEPGSELEIELSFNGGVDFIQAPQRVLFTREPQMTNLGPNLGSVNGGTDVYFQSDTPLLTSSSSFDELWCSFVGSDGETTTTEADIVSREGASDSEGESGGKKGDTVICKAPPSNTLGPRLLRLHTNGANNFIHITQFVYVDEPTVTSLNPSFGPTSGGSRVVLRGASFPMLDSIVASFGGRISPEPCVWLGPTAIRCVTPASAPRDASISISMNGQDFTTEGMLDGIPFVIGVCSEFCFWGFVLASHTYLSL